jgi:hypothetical protein
MQIPKPHQQRIVDLNPKKILLNWEARVGKSLPAAIWIDNPCRTGNTFIICTKQNKKDWIEMGTKATVLTKEELKRVAQTIKDPTAIVVDELHHFNSGLFQKGRSQLSTALYTLVKKYPHCDFMGLSATMIRQSAWSLHTALCYIGIYYDWKKWREEFFYYVKLPFLRFPTWMPKPDWRINIRKYLEKHCDIVGLKDIIKDLPPVETKIISVKHEQKYVRPIDKIVTWVDEHRWEQGGKLEEILKLGYKKIILVCKYTEQIDFLKDKLKDEKPVFVLDGREKDQSAIKKQAQEAEECYFICQSAMGETWDGWSFGCMVFVSLGHSCYQHTQMVGRQRHLEHLRPVEIIYLIGGVWDQRIYDTVVVKGKTFNPFIYLHEEEKKLLLEDGTPRSSQNS